MRIGTRPLGWTGWLLLSLLVHGGIVLAVVLAAGPPPPPPPKPIPVKLVREPEPPPKPKIEPHPLHFRAQPRFRARAPVEIPKRLAALAPPPPDVPLAAQGSSGGFAAEFTAPSAIAGVTLSGEGGGIAGQGFGQGNGPGPRGTSFAQYVGRLRQEGLDVVFVVDATGSMGWLIHRVKDRIEALAHVIRRLVPMTRFGVVAYRDYDDPEFLTRVEPLTLSVGRVRRFLDNLQARGGGDIPEAVDAGLRAAMTKEGWKPDAKAVIVLIGDAPPHPNRMQATLDLVRRFHAKGGTVTALDVSFDANPQLAAERLHEPVSALQTIGSASVMPQFKAIAKAGGGDASSLEGDMTVVRRLAILVFGSHYADQIAPLLGNL